MASPAMVVWVDCFLSVVIDAFRLFVADDACGLSLLSYRLSSSILCVWLMCGEFFRSLFCSFFCRFFGLIPNCSNVGCCFCVFFLFAITVFARVRSLSPCSCTCVYTCLYASARNSQFEIVFVNKIVCCSLDLSSLSGTFAGHETFSD